MRRSHSRSARVEPIPLVTINKRKVAADPVRTRIGVGPVWIDHAAGLPFRTRNWCVPPVTAVPFASAPSVSARDWEEEASVRTAPVRREPWRGVEDPVQVRREPWRGVEDPVELPLRSGASVYVVVLVLVAVFVALLATVGLAGRSATLSHVFGSSPKSADKPVISAPPK